jgi:hypothetical protein
MKMGARIFGPCAALAALCLVPRAYAAEVAGGPPAQVAQERDERWYGWQIALVDVGAIGAFVAMNRAIGHSDLTAAKRAATPWMLAGSTLYLAGGPIIHAVHRNPAAGRSLLFRLLLPLGGGILLGTVAGSSGNGLAVATGSVYGVAAGGITAMAIDWITAREPSREPVQSPATGSAASVQTHVELAPMIAFGADRASLGLAMRF